MVSTVNAGQNVSAKVHVVNQSKQLGQAVAAQLSVSLAAVVGSSPIYSNTQDYSFAAGEAHDFVFPFSIPGDASGAGSVVALLLDPNGNQLGMGSLDIQVGQAQLTFSAPTVLVIPNPGTDVNSQYANYAAQVSVVVKNNTNAPVTRKISCFSGDINGKRGWYAVSGYTTIQGDVYLTGSTVYDLPVTLNPGESQTLVNPNLVTSSDPAYNGNINLPFFNSVNPDSWLGGWNHSFYFQDDLGNKSHTVTTSIADKP
jgi:hypothetical protein